MIDSCGAGGSSSAEVVRKGLSEEGTFELGEEVRHLKILVKTLATTSNKECPVSEIKRT